MVTNKSHHSSNSTGVRHLTITEGSDGQRIDNFLARELKGVPRSRVYRLLRKGEVRINGKRAQPTARLRLGDQVRLPPVRLESASEGPVAVPPGLADRLSASIVHEDTGLLVLNKPSGIAVHGGSGLRFGLIETLRQLRPDDRFLELVHRLDRETSGVLLVARKRSELRMLHALLRDGRVRKSYLALVAGRLPRGPLPVEVPLDRSAKAGGGSVRAHAEGKASRTVFRRLRVFRNPDCSLAEVEIDTGRTHQIRVHGAHVGHPVVGDATYGDFPLNRRLRTLGLRRLFLHAREVVYEEPDGRRRAFVAEPGDDLQSVLRRLEGEQLA